MAISVSVVIPTYNRADIVSAAIDSVLSQDYFSPAGNVETIIVDDGSTDELSRALRRYKDQLRLVRHDRNLGAAAARNTGVAAASGTYIAFLDSDDTWLPGKLTTQIAHMEAHGYRASCTAYLLKYPGAAPFVSPQFSTGSLAVSDLVWGCFVSPGSTLVCRREDFAEVGGLDEALGRLEDWDWLMRYVRLRPLGFLARPLARIDVAPGGHGQKVLAAIRRLEQKHADLLSPGDRRHFIAALHVERSAAYRHSHRLGFAVDLARAWWLVPTGNRALAAVLHNRLRRYAPRWFGSRPLLAGPGDGEAGEGRRSGT